ncbi:molybdopterin-guanine dinucleotide biosynthesis protein B [Chitinilyticum litopenaei]|uniref:molybdopterin-guanine dinucleotide biosynthesis protein B n=1 Tax=Chitinilyticum litopenaei TaxID=1121276 RepID=UPI000427E20B|nr:molybdopterin-guanine dinucleotide biosynthesis protein B [Chitinilyticum litopenaei]
MMKVLGICGWSGSGKTTLIEKLLPVLMGMDLRVNVIKHSHHIPAMEPPTKDSARFREAGAQEVMLATPWGFVLSHPLREAPEPALADLLARLAPADLTLVEGFKREAIPRLEVWRAANGKPLLATDDHGIVAVASDSRPADSDVHRRSSDGDSCDSQPAPALPWLDLNDIPALAAFIVSHLKLDTH